jgi:hypothetical protein
VSAFRTIFVVDTPYFACEHLSCSHSFLPSYNFKPKSTLATVHSSIPPAIRILLASRFICLLQRRPGARDLQNSCQCRFLRGPKVSIRKTHQNRTLHRPCKLDSLDRRQSVQFTDALESKTCRDLPAEPCHSIHQHSTLVPLSSSARPCSGTIILQRISDKCSRRMT